MNEETIKQYVEEVLLEIPETREDDTLLQFNVLTRMGYAEIKGTNLIIDLKKIDEMPKFETIRRLRQLIQSPTGENRLYPNEKVEQNRQKKERYYKEHFSTRNKQVDEMPNSWMM